VSDAVLNIVIGLVTSTVSGGSVWAWKRAGGARVLHRKQAFFGLHPDRSCIIILNSHWQFSAATDRSDVHAIMELAAVADEVGCPYSLLAADAGEINGDRTELGIGGLGSNPRNVGYAASQLPGVTLEDDAFTIAGQRFQHDQGRHDHALVAKFTPPQSTQPVLMIVGQSSVANHAAVYFLRRNYRDLSRSVASLDRFCLVLRADSTDTYGYQSVQLVADLSEAAF
jgi:hypothetical protein